MDSSRHGNRNPEDGTVIRCMRPGDLRRGVELSRCVNWNQLPNDWQRFLTLGRQGCFVAEYEGRVVGTVTTINYKNRFGWVGMVIVDPIMRRKGIGTKLLEWGIEYLEEIGVETVKLDATPQGRLLYDTMGFRDEYGAARWEGLVPEVKPPARAVRLETKDIQAISELDTPLFGADRRQVIALYMEHYPERCLVVRSDDGVEGYLCGRPGHDAEHIGPWVAKDRDVAEDLLLTRLADCTGERVFVDTVDPCPASSAILDNLGFKIQRPFIRMYRGPNNYPGQPEYIYGISGPELG